MRLDFATWVLLLFPTALLLAPDLYSFYLNQAAGMSFSTFGELWHEYGKETYKAIKGNWAAVDFILELKAFLVGGVITVLGTIIAMLYNVIKTKRRNRKSYTSRNTQNHYEYKYKRK